MSPDPGLRLTSVLALLLLGLAPVARAQPLANQAFGIEYDQAGIRSLKRTNDVHDTDYIAANGRLGNLVIRYRATPQGDWRDVREIVGMDRSPDGRTISYTLGTLLPTLAAKSTPSAQIGVGTLRALGDGRVPAAPAAAGRGGQGGPPPTGAGAGRGGPEPVPIFTWQGSRGDT